MRTWLSILATLALLCAIGAAQARQIVRVGAYSFPPYVTIDAAGEAQIELVELLNRHQDRYEFRIVTTSPSRRYYDFSRNAFDVMFYENRDWGWQRYPVEVSPVYLTGGEQYVALQRPGRTQRYFDDFSGKRMLGMRGYHYGFASFNSDPEFLRRKFGMIGTTNNEATLRLLLDGKGDVAVVTSAYLSQYLAANPELRSRLMISDRLDQEYRHTILVRSDFEPNAAELAALLRELEKSGVLRPLWQKYGSPGRSDPDKLTRPKP
ncbi:substrate-binding periplasmic protein [Chitinilyticum aquatile]|uniref:substrate-binding periplasmic protein n=1 Tax=Chitinilyticum aquatile TaxID=362520 RepID=UPI0004032B15|nr:transporter substrate-binding domain-containing protein [Chitinilyticum aquatile]